MTMTRLVTTTLHPALSTMPARTSDSSVVKTIDPPESTSSSLPMASAIASLMASSVVTSASATSASARRMATCSATIDTCNGDDGDDNEVMSAVRLHQSSSTTALHLLPQLISVTVPKKRDQPAGLTLISNNGVIISAISPTSPFHIDNNMNKFDDGGGNIVEHGRIVSSDNTGQNSSPVNINSSSKPNFLQSSPLQVKDEILLINSHRVKNPKRAVQLIKGIRSGQLNIVASRGRGGELRREGMAYVLARVDRNPFVTCSGDVRDEADRGETRPSLSPSSFSSASPPLPSSTIQYGDTLHGLQFSSLTPLSSAGTSTNVSLTRISYKSNTTGPFVNTDLKLGDIVLSVDGDVLSSVGDAERLMLSRSESSSGLLEAGIHDSTSRSGNTRVVILLVYSLWDLRKRVLEKTLKIDISEKKTNYSKDEGCERTAVAGHQLWQASYSYELPTKNDDEVQKEYILLRIQKTNVTFQLDFDSNGNCSCRDHYQSLLSLNSMEEQQRQSREIRNAMMGKGDESKHSNVDDSESIDSDVNNSIYSRDEALAALELLYQIHVVPVIDALNINTRRQLALLAEAVDAANASASPATSSVCTRQANDHGGSYIKGILDGNIEETSASLPILPLLTADDTITSSYERGAAERRQDNQQTLSSPSEIPPRQKEEIRDNQIGTRVDVGTIVKLKPEMWMNYVRNESNPEVSLLSANSTERVSGLSRYMEESSSPQRVPRRHSVQSFTSKDPIASGIQRFVRSQALNEAPSSPIRNRLHAGEEGQNDDNSPELNPNRLINNPLPVLEPTNQSTNTAHNQRRPPTKLQRKPSIVPDCNLHYASFRSALSALSDSNDDSSGSNTISSGSDDSISSSDSESTGGDDEHSGRWERSQACRGNVRQTSRSPNNSELIVHTPGVNDEESKRTRPSPTAYTPSKVHPFTRRLKMRHGEIRKFYKVLHHVEGQGSFGTVRTCVHRSTRQRYVVKSMTMDGNMKNANLLQDEIALVQRVNHRNVVSVRDVIQDRQFIHIIMEKCHGGDLFDKIVNGGVRLSEDRACAILSELLDAVAYLHDRNIVHRDLKAEHIMLLSEDINSSIKIIDFGLATIHGPNDPPLTALAGSAFTIAPEVISRSYGKSCDLWSVGVVAYFLLTSSMPFNAKSDELIFAKIQGGRYSYPKWARWGLSETAKDFVGRLLVVDPKRRYHAKQALGDTWIRKNVMNCSLRTATRTNLHEFALVQSPSVLTSSHPSMRIRHQKVPPKPTMSPLQLSSRPYVSPDLIQNAIDPQRSGQSMPPPQKQQQQQLRRGPERQRCRGPNLGVTYIDFATRHNR